MATAKKSKKLTKDQQAMNILFDQNKQILDTLAKVTNNMLMQEVKVQGVLNAISVKVPQPRCASNEEPILKPMLHRAEELIGGDRQRDYGDKLQNFSQIAMIWQGILATKLQKGSEVNAEDVALCMMGVKMARLAKSPDHKDSILDVAGYAGCYDKIQEERNAGTELAGATTDSRWMFSHAFNEELAAMEKAGI